MNQTQEEVEGEGGGGVAITHKKSSAGRFASYKHYWITFELISKTSWWIFANDSWIANNEELQLSTVEKNFYTDVPGGEGPKKNQKRNHQNLAPRRVITIYIGHLLLER